MRDILKDAAKGSAHSVQTKRIIHFRGVVKFDTLQRQCLHNLFIGVKDVYFIYGWGRERIFMLYSFVVVLTILGQE